MYTIATYYQIGAVYTWLSQSGPENTNKLHKDVAQMPMVSTPITMPSAATYAPVASWGVPYDYLTKEEKTGA